MISISHNLAFVHDNNAICHSERGELVCDYYDCQMQVVLTVLGDDLLD